MNKKEHLQGTRDIHLYIFIYISYTVKTNLYTFVLILHSAIDPKTTKATELHIQNKQTKNKDKQKLQNNTYNTKKATKLHITNQTKTKTKQKLQNYTYKTNKQTNSTVLDVNLPATLPMQGEGYQSEFPSLHIQQRKTTS